MSNQFSLPPYLFNSRLFQDYYLWATVRRTLPLAPEEALDHAMVLNARAAANTVLDNVLALWDERRAVLAANEANVEHFVAEVCRLLGLAVSRQGNVSREDTATQRVDLTLFVDDAAAAHFATMTAQRQRAAVRYAHALAIVEVEHGGKPIAPNTAPRDNPEHHLITYLTFTGVPWGILTDGHTWRVYRRFDPPRFGCFLEIDLAQILDMPRGAAQQQAFWWFYGCFSRAAFDRHDHPARLERWYQGSVRHATGVQEALREQAYQVVESLARGLYATHPDPTTADLVLLYEQAIVILYRLLFLKFAEDCELLPVHNQLYKRYYSYTYVQNDLLICVDNPVMTLGVARENSTFWQRLSLLFDQLYTGNAEVGIFAYTGSLFAPTRLAGVVVPDAFLAQAVSSLARIAQNGSYLRVSYRDLEIRHLGRIYEGLLEQHLERHQGTVALMSSAGERSNERHTSGSYYTPDYIVDYMVEQTIAPLCKGKTAQEIATITLLDPSMGSGHFLVTALNTLAYYHATAKKRELLLPPEQEDCEHNEAYQERLSKYYAEVQATTAEVAQSERELVEQCIYGVDRNPLAVELAKLALWLSTFAKNQALAFLDHHLRVGNSLVGARIEQLGSLTGNSSNGKNSTHPQQRGLVEDIFLRVQTHILEYFQRIAALPNDSPAQVHAKEQAYAAFRHYSEPFRQVANLWVQQHMGQPLSNDHYERTLAALDEYYALPHNLAPWERICQSPWFLAAQETATTEYLFHWELEFPQVFLRAAKGFDGVVGNPPYVRQEMFQSLKPFLRTVYPAVYHGTADIYVYFVQQGLALVRPGGVLSYISSNKWFRANYGTKLRSYLAQYTTLQRLIDFGDARVFPDATTYPSILMLQNGTPPTMHQFPVFIWKPTYGKIAQFADRVEEQRILVTQADLATGGWSLGSADVCSLLTKLRRMGMPLGEYVQGRFYRGIVTGLNEAFIVDRATRDTLVRESLVPLVSDSMYAGIKMGLNEAFVVDQTTQLIATHPSSADMLKPFLRGRDVKRWRVEPPDLWLIFPPRGVDITAYPAVYHHLLAYRERLAQRASGGYAWYALQAHPGDTQRFDHPKIVYPDIAKAPAFAYDTQQYYPGNTLYVLPTTALWLLGILNSSLIFWFVSQISTHIRGGYVRFIAQYVEQIPIPDTPADTQTAIGTLAHKLTTLAQARYTLHQEVRHRIRADLGSPTHKLTPKLARWWELAFPALRGEVKRAFGSDIPLRERKEWEQWIGEQHEHHTHKTREIIALEKQLNSLVYDLFALTSAERAMVEAQTSYPYGEV